jgi:hypothetical protein
MSSIKDHKSLYSKNSKKIASSGTHKSHHSKVSKISHHSSRSKNSYDTLQKEIASKNMKRNEHIEKNEDNVGAISKEVYFNGKRLRIKKFDVSTMIKVAPSPSVAMIAKRGSGKSVAIRAIMHMYRFIPGGIVISRTEKMSPFFSQFFPDLFIHYKYTSELIESLLIRQEEMKLKNQRRISENKLPVDSRAWLIMDDCLAHKGTWARDENMMEVFMDGRHFDLFFILTMQYPLGIGPDLRTNFDFIFIFGENFTNIQKKVYEHYAGMFDDFDSFRSVFKKCTVNFGCMVINNRVKSDRVDEMVYWWKAPNQHIKKLIGHKTFIRRHNVRFDPAYKEKLKKVKDINDFCRKKRNAREINIDLIE